MLRTVCENDNNVSHVCLHDDIDEASNQKWNRRSTEGLPKV